MSSGKRLAHGLTLMVGDVSAIIAAFVTAYALAGILEARLGWEFVNFHKGAGERATVAIPVATLCLLWFGGRGHYGERLPHWSEVREILTACVMATVAECFLQYALKDQVSRLWITLTWVLLCVICVLVRIWMKWCLTTLGLRTMSVALFGDGDGTARAAITSERLLGYSVVADLPRTAPTDVVEAFRVSGADLAIVATGRNGYGRASRTALALSEAEVPFALCPPLGTLGLASMRPLVLFGHEAMLLVERKGLKDPSARAAKRIGDLLAASVGLGVSAPLVAAAAALVALDGANPFFGHRRIGRDGRVIRVWKIRSMVSDADDRLERLLATDPEAAAEWHRDRKLRRDPRVTAMGRLLRRSALDELPQLWNVLRGDMSLVGPRPVTPEEMTRYGASGRLYVGVRPGLTGLWQVSGRNATTYERRVELDSWYVRNWSLWVDTVILLRTVSTVLTGKGAC